MRTLDEVIAIMDGIDQTCTCCAYQHDCDEVECVEKTALHYLKEYRDDKQNFAEAISNSGKAEQRYIMELHALEAEKERYQEAGNKYIKAKEDLESQRLHMMWVDKNFKLEEPNNPLTPDELTAMKGKPVWIEQKGFTPQWVLVLRYGKRHLYTVDANYFEAEYDWDGCGSVWTAYRKERE